MRFKFEIEGQAKKYRHGGNMDMKLVLMKGNFQSPHVEQDSKVDNEPGKIGPFQLEGQ